MQGSCPPDGIVADFFAGSGTAGAAAYEQGQRFLMVDSNPEACQVMAKRFAAYEGVAYTGIDGPAQAADAVQQSLLGLRST